MESDYISFIYVQLKICLGRSVTKSDQFYSKRKKLLKKKNE